MDTIHPHPEGTGSFHGDSPFDNDTFPPRMPTLLNVKRNGEHLVPRKKSSKRRKADHEREAEIRKMSNFMPSRPAVEWQSGRPMKRDTRRIKTGLGLGFRRSSLEADDPLSDISLPLPGSIHSSLSDESEHVSFKVSALEALAPRPTLKYSVHPRFSSPPTGPGPQMSTSQRKRLAEIEPIPKATLKAHKRIDNLADDLDARDLRELMERDQRRRERKRERDQERVERRLTRKAEQQKAAEREGRDSPPNMERGVMGRDLLGLGDGPASAVVTSSKRKAAPDASPKQLGKRPASDDDDEDAGEEDLSQGPLGNFHRVDSIPLDNTFMTGEDQPTSITPQTPVKQDFLPVAKRPRSKSPGSSQPSKTDMSESLRKTSEGSSGRGGLSWSSIFRWGNRGKRHSGPSSFSNTSRDSMSAAHVPTAPIPIALGRKLSSGVPKRTMSRFREDLPDFPLSPPDSRYQSPDADAIPPVIMEQDSPDLDHDEPIEVVQVQQGTEDVGLRESPTSVDATIPLGSIDSEGSWFGGRSKRQSPNPPSSPPQSRQRDHQHTASNGSSDVFYDPDLPTQEDTHVDDGVFIADEEYLSPFAGQRDSGSHFTQRESTIASQPSANEDDDAHWGSVNGRYPTVVHSLRPDLVKSREGLLNTFDEADESEFGELSGDGNILAIGEDKENSLQRATSIDLGQRQARHISAGSAKLMHITPRPSVDAKGHV